MPNTAGQPVNKAPYKVVLRDGKYLVLNNAGEVKGAHPNRDAALAQLRALYATVPGAGKAADRKPWTGTQKRAVKADDSDNGPIDEAGVGKHTFAPSPTDDTLCFFCGLTYSEGSHDGRIDDSDPAELAKQFPAAKRDKMAGKGQAMPGGGFPIENEQDLCNAIAAVGRAKNPAAAKAHIKKRAAALGKTNLLPASWRQSARVQELPVDVVDRLRSRYGLQVAAATPLGVAPAPTPEPDDNDLPQGPKSKAAEDTAIAASVGTPAAKKPHPFMPAQYPADDGQPRCRLCGQGTPPHDEFEPERPMTAEQAHRKLKPHHYVGAQHLRDHVMSTAGYFGGCYACGKPQGDPTHTGDVSQPPPATAAPDAPAPSGPSPSDNTTTASISTSAQRLVVHDRLAPVVQELHEKPHGDDRVKAFVTEAHGKTLLTAPASAFYSDRELALASNEHFLWMNGRFVGAEKANRNGALWSTNDLELGQVSVKHGPLNWLHEARHVIGTIADARLHTQNMAADRELDQPYIEAASVIWKWIYPDEAWVVEQASDANKLWYSMECVSKEVECAGQTGCGATASYGDYLAGKGGTCDHMRERSGTRRFANPTFLGGAVIVPPVRPGWAEADAQVMQQAASLAEKAYEQAQPADTSASEWEQLMAQVLRFAQT